METSQIRAVLAAVPLFAETLDERQLDHLAAQCNFVIFPPEAVMIAEGDFADAMFVIAAGQVEVTLHDSHGGEHQVAVLGAGDVVGEMALFTGLRRSATTVARSEVEAIEITKVAFEDMFARTPDLIDRFSPVLAKRQSELDQIAAEAEADATAMGARIRRFFGLGSR